MPFVLFMGCSDGEDSTLEKAKQERIFNEQRQALEQAKQVEQFIQNKDIERRLTIDEQGQ